MLESHPQDGWGGGGGDLQCRGPGPPCCTSQGATSEGPGRKGSSGDLHHIEPYGLQEGPSELPGTREEKAVTRDRAS